MRFFSLKRVRPVLSPNIAGNYYFRKGFDGGLRFNYGSYTDNTILNTPGIRPNVNGSCNPIPFFFGRVW